MKPLNEVMKQIRLKSKGRRSGYVINNRNRCRYRSYDDNCCLVGAFIPDDVYDVNMEGMSVTDLVVNFKKVSQFMPFDISTMNKLQNFHDRELGHLEGEDFFKTVERFLVTEIYNKGGINE